jgi:hypothetical protein
MRNPADRAAGFPAFLPVHAQREPGDHDEKRDCIYAAVFPDVHIKLLRQPAAAGVVSSGARSGPWPRMRGALNLCQVE